MKGLGVGALDRGHKIFLPDGLLRLLEDDVSRSTNTPDSWALV